MPNEDDELQGSQTASESTESGEAVSHDELSRAFDEAVNGETSEVAEKAAPEEAKEEGGKEEGEVPEEGEAAESTQAEETASVEEETPPKKKGDPDHPTALGRKVAKLEDMVSELLKQNTELIAKQNRPAPESGEMPADPSAWTEEQIQARYDELYMESPYKATKFLKEAESVKVTGEVAKYQGGYLTSLKGWQESADDQEAAAEVYKLLTDDKSPFNVKHSANPSLDFQINLSKAEAHYYKTKASPAKRDNPLEKNKAITTRGPLGVAPASKPAPVAPTKQVVVDPVVAEFAKDSGFSEEEVQNILAGTTSSRRGR